MVAQRVAQGGRHHTFYFCSHDSGAPVENMLMREHENVLVHTSCGK